MFQKMEKENVPGSHQFQNNNCTEDYQVLA